MLFSWTLFEKLYYLQTLISKWPCYHRWKLRIPIYTPRCCLEKGKPWHRSDWKWGNITSDNFIWGFEYCDHRQPNEKVKGKSVAVYIMKACRGCEGKFQAFISMDWIQTLRLQLAFSQKKKQKPFYPQFMWLLSPLACRGNGGYKTIFGKEVWFR
jgi:hypothetical protein